MRVDSCTVDMNSVCVVEDSEDHILPTSPDVHLQRLPVLRILKHSSTGHALTVVVRSAVVTKLEHH